MFLCVPECILHQRVFFYWSAEIKGARCFKMFMKAAVKYWYTFYFCTNLIAVGDGGAQLKIIIWLSV
jgi:hypothetical protein